MFVNNVSKLYIVHVAGIKDVCFKRVWLWYLGIFKIVLNFSIQAAGSSCVYLSSVPHKKSGWVYRQNRGTRVLLASRRPG